MAKKKENIDTDALSKVLQSFDESNKYLDDAYLAMKDVRETLKNCWEGRAKDKYILKFDVISDRFKERVQPAKEGYAKVLKNVISGFDNTESTNIAIANAMSGDNKTASNKSTSKVDTSVNKAISKFL